MTGISSKFRIGNMFIGGDSPVLLQSMTNTDTRNVHASVEQCMRIFDAGADMVRLTTPSLKDLESLKEIRKELRRQGYENPLVADVHFSPRVAMEAADVVEKVRINPGNYLENMYMGPEQYDERTAVEYAEKLHDNLLPLIQACQRNETAIRIGVNHGSLSERIKTWYGNTPEGMVESALEFMRIFHSENFEKLVVSLKASSTRVMIMANRMLVKRMMELGYSYPLHLGVTEAGNEEEGRSRSALGIGSLLKDGIGDTIRVSLTEDPEFEIPVARSIVEHSGRSEGHPEALFTGEHAFNPFDPVRRPSRKVNITGDRENINVLTGSYDTEWSGRELMLAGYGINPDFTLKIYPQSADLLFTGNTPLPNPPVKGISFLCDYPLWLDKYRYKIGFFPLLQESDLVGREVSDEIIAFYRISSLEEFTAIEDKIPGNIQLILILDVGEEKFTRKVRKFFNEYRSDWPVILHVSYKGLEYDELVVRASVDLGSVIIDGMGDGIWLENDHPSTGTRELRSISFRLLQSAGVRISATEYIACPSCGRTLFNIQETLKRVKAATRELTGVKIAVMGCIVNGPGEMADADYGYVGAGPGRVTLYKGSEAVKKNIPEGEAVDELLRIIHREESP